MVKSVTSESGTAGSAYYQISETHYFFYPLTRFSTVGSLGDRNIACSAADRHDSNFKYCVWMAVPTQQARDIDPMLDRCWASVVVGVPILFQHWVDVSCLLGSHSSQSTQEQGCPKDKEQILRIFSNLDSAQNQNLQHVEIFVLNVKNNLDTK